MSAVGKSGRLYGLRGAVFGSSIALTFALVASGFALADSPSAADEHSAQRATSGSGPAAVTKTISELMSPISTSWDGKTPPSLEELGHFAARMSQILTGASDRVDQLVADEQPAAVAVAVRHELMLSRRWNQHLKTILQQVAEARRELGARERQAAAEIGELTEAAEEARRELVALKEALNADGGQTGTSVPQDRSGEDDQSVLDRGQSDAALIAEGLSSSAAGIDDASETLAIMHDAQKAAVDDIEKIRAKIIDALRLLKSDDRELPSDALPIGRDPAEGRETGSSLSSEDITAWAASIASKLHHEGSDDLVIVGSPFVTEPPVTEPLVEVMRMDGEALLNAIVRAAPDLKAIRIAVVPAGNAVLVTGKVVDRNWYRIEFANGRHGFVSGHLIRRQPS